MSTTPDEPISDDTADGADDMLKPYLESVAYVTNVRQWAAGLSDGARIDVVSAIFATAPEDWRPLALAHLNDKYAPNPFARLATLGRQAREAAG